jgi:ribosome maturation factor RimP
MKSGMRKQEQWHTLLAPTLQDTPYELVGVECVGQNRHTVVRIFIDKPGGITIADIVKLTRELSVVFDVEEPIRGPYTLEISSPGLDRRLFLPAHFASQIGQKLSVKTSLPLNDRQNFRGVLRKATETGIELEVETELFSFTYDEIDRAKVIPDIQISGSK